MHVCWVVKCNRRRLEGEGRNLHPQVVDMHHQELAVRLGSECVPVGLVVQGAGPGNLPADVHSCELAFGQQCQLSRRQAEL